MLLLTAYGRFAAIINFVQVPCIPGADICLWFSTCNNTQLYLVDSSMEAKMNKIKPCFSVKPSLLGISLQLCDSAARLLSGASQLENVI